MHAQGVIVEFDYGYEELDRLHDLELRLMAAIDEAGVGEYDGHEIAMDGTDGTLYMYGPDADSLFAVVRPLLESSSFMQGATAALQYGPPDETTLVKFVIIGD